MSDNTEWIKQIESRLEILFAQQANLSEEANRLRESLQNLKEKEIAKPEISKPLEETTPPVEPIPIQLESEPDLKEVKPEKISAEFESPKPDTLLDEQTSNVNVKSNIEKFIGENLINKIGIIITVLGVAIGAKYSIENGLISPSTRIILGYVIGIGLLGFGMKLKTKYESYSSVLVSGAMTILYFITFLGYSLYDLFPQLFAFGLMLVFTGFTVYAALNYKKQIIALLGLVGAYAVPFLLSTGSGRVDILFSYMAIINTGILVISLKQNWKLLYNAAFGLTWLIYLAWMLLSYSENEHFVLAFTFALLFFVIFYMTFIGYKLKYKKKFRLGNIVILLLNSFIFYGIGYWLLYENGNTDYVGMFTLANAAIHFVVSAAIYRLKLAERHLFFLISGLVLVFITLAIPVQLDGNWVTLLWISEAALLFWIGRTKDVPIYERLSYPLIGLAFLSLLEDWGLYYLDNTSIFGLEGKDIFTPIFNVQFLNSLLFVAGMAFIVILWKRKEYMTEKIRTTYYYDVLNRLLPAILLGIIYFTFFLEISTFWTQKLNQSEIINLLNEGYGNYTNQDMREFRSIWLVNYTMIFAGILSFINMKWLKNNLLGKVNLVFNLLAIISFLILGLYAISELREYYIDNILGEYYSHGPFNIGIRYLSLTFLAGLVYISFKYIKEEFMAVNLKKIFDVVLHVSIVWVLSSELLSIMNFSGTTHNYKLGLSILWGVYSLMVIAYGIWKDNAFLRIGAIALFALTLLKVFLYDISHLDTIAKTIVFVSLGVLLLIISFLYNKYKHIISYDQEN
ncbi:MAG: hypothetical protein COA58_00035 [Bacteroidetes bacterium]|nr:MAG: hypothetical protein COA58_00035 [Bacteroidota bacterium]